VDEIPQHQPERRPRLGRGRPRWTAIASACVLIALPAAVTLTLTRTGGAGPLRAPEQRDAAPPILREVDGGPEYYARFPRSLPSVGSYFPIGVWFESVLSQEDIDADKRAGLNLYVVLTGNSDLRLIARSGMKVLAQHEDWVARADAPGSEAIAGWVLADEVDMQMSPQDGFAEMRSLAAVPPSGDGRLRYTNYGKGVVFWNSDAQAARYVNKFQDVVSADTYWFTDDNICGRSEGGALLAGDRRLSQRQCHRAANYGRTVDRIRGLIRPAGSRPVWVFVEVGHPFVQSDWPSIEPAEVGAAVWSGIIHGARGVVYFNHSFGGPAPTQHALREPEYSAVRSVVARTNARIRRLAPVLNAPFVERFASTSAAVDTMTKRAGDHFYIFAASRVDQEQRATFRLPCAGHTRASVVDEDRTLPVSDGSFADGFADGNAVHVYRIDESGCLVSRD
jgi:hypothetical protein